MADTVHTVADLLTNLFQDGQAAGSITAQDVRDLIVSLVPSYGGMYFETNATATTIAVIGTWYKVAGTTIAYADLTDFTMPADNRLTYADTIQRHFHVYAALSITNVTNNQVGEVCFFKNGVKIPGTVTEFKCLAAGDPTSVPMLGQVDLVPNDFVEVYIKNESGANNFTVEYMNVSIDGHSHA